MTTRSRLLSYGLLGPTGLRMAPLALGAMTFGNDEWGAATKFTVTRRPGDPNAGGNGRKNLLASLEASLRRPRTDYVDVYWLHVWDTRTPAEEVMATFDALVRSGKVRAVGLSDTPAWYAARAQMLAWARGWEPVAALQLEYSLVERNIEREHLPAARDLGMSVTPWSPLAHRFLSGKYDRAADGGGVTGQGGSRRSPPPPTGATIPSRTGPCSTSSGRPPRSLAATPRRSRSTG